MAMFKAFFDETGTHAESTTTGIGGYVGHASEWDKLEPQWDAVLSEFADKGVTWFHMAEALAQQGQFQLIDKTALRYMVTQFSQKLGTHELTPFFSAVVTNDWRVIEDHRFLARFPKPIDLCFENLVQTLFKWSAECASGELVIPMFAYAKGYSERMAEILNAYGTYDWYRKVLGPIAFGFPQQVIPLQAADLLAHQMNFDVARPLPEKLAQSGPTNVLWWATGNGGFVEGRIFDAEGLLRTVNRFKEAGYPSGPVDLF
jgi:hypothetical protein